MFLVELALLLIELELFLVELALLLIELELFLVDLALLLVDLALFVNELLNQTRQVFEPFAQPLLPFGKALNGRFILS